MSEVQDCIGAEAVQEKDEEKSEQYTQEMNSKMGSGLTYRHEDGLNFAHILDNLIVGSCLQTAADVHR